MTSKSILLTAVAVSALLHALALDYWRGRVREPNAADSLPATRIEGRLREEGRLKPAPPSVLTSGDASRSHGPLVEQALVATSRETVPVFEAAGAPIGVGNADIGNAGNASVGNDAPQTVALPDAVSDSFAHRSRPWSRQEGVAGYRLAMAQTPWFGPAAAGDVGAAVLRFSVSATGETAWPVVVRSSGDPQWDQTAAQWIAHASKQARVPDVLRGTDFELEILIEP